MDHKLFVLAVAALVVSVVFAADSPSPAAAPNSNNGINTAHSPTSSGNSSNSSSAASAPQTPAGKSNSTTTFNNFPVTFGNKTSTTPSPSPSSNNGGGKATPPTSSSSSSSSRPSGSESSGDDYFEGPTSSMSDAPIASSPPDPTLDMGPMPADGPTFDAPTEAPSVNGVASVKISATAAVLAAFTRFIFV